MPLYSRASPISSNPCALTPLRLSAHSHIRRSIYGPIRPSAHLRSSSTHLPRPASMRPPPILPQVSCHSVCQSHPLYVVNHATNLPSILMPLCRSLHLYAPGLTVGFEPSEDHLGLVFIISYTGLKDAAIKKKSNSNENMMSSGGRPFLLTSWQPHVLQFLKRIYRSIGHSPGVAIILCALKSLRHHFDGDLKFVCLNTIAAGISIKDGSGSYNGERALEGRVTNLTYFRGGFKKTEGARAGVSRARSILNLSIDRMYQQITLTPSRLF